MHKRYPSSLRSRQYLLRFGALVFFIVLLIISLFILADIFRPVVSPTVESSGVTVIFLSPTPVIAR